MALETSDAAARRLVNRDERLLAPKFADAVQAAEDELWTTAGITIFIYETIRTNELAEMYYRLNRSNSPNGFYTWHFYGLAVDVVHPTKLWKAWPTWNNIAQRYEGGDVVWWHQVVAAFKKHGCDWGGDWNSIKDTPHFQWGKCNPTPVAAPKLFMTGGVEAVWKAVGAQ